MAMFRFWLEIFSLDKFGLKDQYFQFKLNFCICTNSNIQNSMVMFTLSPFDRKYPFWVNLFQKMKIVVLKIPHINSATNPFPPLPMMFSSISDSFFMQALVLLLFQNVATLTREEEQCDLFQQNCPFHSFLKCLQ